VAVTPSLSRLLNCSKKVALVSTPLRVISVSPRGVIVSRNVPATASTASSGKSTRALALC
jgi:hypothetical protein